MADLALPSFYVAPDVMQEAADTQSFLLKVPERAKVAGKFKFWTELFDILSSEMSVVEDHPDRVCVKIVFRVSPESEYLDNATRKVTQWYYMNPGSMGDKTSKERQMTLISLGKLGAILKALGADTSAGWQPQDFFAANVLEGTEPWAQGKKLFGLVKQGPDKQGQVRDEINKFDDLTAGTEV